MDLLKAALGCRGELDEYLEGISEDDLRAEILAISNRKELRDYFIAHAPEAIPEWFQPVMPPGPVHPGERPKTIDLLNPGRNVETPETQEWCTRMVQYKIACDQFYEQTVRQRSIQWPVAWADLMLAERVKGDTQ